MKQATIPLTGRVERVAVNDVSGDLQATGWDRPELTAKTDGDTVELNFANGVVNIRCDGALIIYMPRAAGLSVNNVERDVDVRAIAGAVDFGNIGGDAQLRDVGSIAARNVGCDLNVRSCSGDIRINNVGDDASLHEVKGDVLLEAVGSDLFLRGASGNVRSSVGSDAILYLEPRAGSDCQISAGSDILLRLPANVDATLDLTAGGEDGIRIDLPGVESFEETQTRQVTLGSGAAAINLTAGDDIIVTSQAEEWESMAEFDTAARDGSFVPGDFVPADLHERIHRQVEEAMRGAPSNLQDQIRERVDEATRRAIEHSRRAMERAEHASDHSRRKVEAAMRRAEQKIRAAERQAHGHGAFRFNMTVPSAPRPPASDPVSDEERLSILRMLQEKKISREQAEQLLAALEGR
jgi:hypothetical protein